MKIRCEVNGDKITLDKEEIERMKDHYSAMAGKYPRFNIRKFYYYTGLADAMINLLKEIDNAEE
jgi:hypothetical protein